MADIPPPDVRSRKMMYEDVMGNVDTRNASNPERRRLTGPSVPRQFRDRMPPAAKRHHFIRMEVLNPARDAPVNPDSSEVDPAEATKFIKAWVTEQGADAVGIAALDPRFIFSDATPPDHRFVVVFAMSMAYDAMIDIGPNSQDEVHKVYYRLDDLGVRLAQQIGAFGYGARMQPNEGDIPIIPYAWLAGLGELGKHGSLISPRLGSSFRLGAVTTDIPLVADGPQDFGIEEVCASCNVCARFCPGDAIKHEKTTVAGVERWYVDTPACLPYFRKLYGCKICLMVCPLNAKGNLRDQFKLVARDIRDAKDAGGLLRLFEERSGLNPDDYDYDLSDEVAPVDSEGAAKEE